jgi:hypothetical protein
MLYVLYDKDGASIPPIFGVYDSLEAVNTAMTVIAGKMTDECLAGDPSETGLDESDRAWVFRECRDSLGVQYLPEINTSIYDN